MRRRRRQLEVSTFPFLAVLLCTMGSLILLLLVLDRRAKIVALHKAQSDYALARAENERLDEDRLRQQAEEERLAQKQRAEWEERQRQLHALLAQDEQELLGQIDQARGQVAAAAAKLEKEQSKADNQQNQMQMATTRLAGSKQAMAAQQDVAAKAGEQTEAAKRELEKQAAAVQQLELTLASLKVLRERQKNTYSLVPYLGRRGDNRRPVYLECAATAIVIHPERLTLEGLQLSDERIRAEVEKRVGNLREPGPSQSVKEAQRPYLLMLVRPDGINNYYRVQESLAGVKVDFGYEFIERDWVLDFSGDGHDVAAQPWMKSATLPSPLTASPLQPERKGGGGNGGYAVGGGGVQQGPGGSAAAGVQGGTPGIPGLPQFKFGPKEAWQSAGSGVAGGGSSAAPGGSPASGAGVNAGGAQPGFGTPPTNVSGATTPGSSAGNAKGVPPPPPGSGNGVAQDSGGTAKVDANPGSSGISLGQPTLAGGKEPPPQAPLGRILGNRDWPIYIECNADRVVVTQGNKTFSIESLSAKTSGEHPLTKTVREMIARRQATVRAGEPPYRPLLRFQVKPDGLRSYYLAYPLLDGLRVPMARENVVTK